MQYARKTATLDVFDPELRGVARLLPNGQGLSRGYRLPRALLTVLGLVFASPTTPVLRVNDDVTIRLHRRRVVGEPGPVLLWIHGGGFVMGSARQEDKFCQRVMRRTNIPVAAVDYRLAPKDAFPTPLEDCYAALSWLAQQPWVDPSRIAIGGASAGGGLAASLAIIARDRGVIEPACQLLLYPMLDDRTGADATSAHHKMWSVRDNLAGWRWYLDGADPEVAAPARRSDLSGLAPAWIGVSNLDLLCAESVSYGQRLREAGVPCQEHIVDGAFHAFDGVAPYARVSVDFRTSFAAELRTRVGA